MISGLSYHLDVYTVHLIRATMDSPTFDKMCDQISMSVSVQSSRPGTGATHGDAESVKGDGDLSQDEGVDEKKEEEEKEEIQETVVPTLTKRLSHAVRKSERGLGYILGWLFFFFFFRFESEVQ